LLPDQAPEAVQAVAFDDDHVSMAALPELTVLGAALSVTDGANAETVTVADCVADPPAPVQVNSYSVVVESGPVDAVPLVAIVPCQPPEAIQAVAFSALQVRLDFSPAATVAGVALSLTVGVLMTAISTDCVADPPVPSQVSVKFVVALRGLVVAVPLVGCEPVQPPDATHVCASWAFHCNVAAVCIGTLVLSATNVTAGFAVLTPAGSVLTVSPFDEKPHAASAENAAKTTVRRNKRQTLNDDLYRKLLDVLSPHARKKDREAKSRLRSARFTNRLPYGVGYRSAALNGVV
jgi:hypothetical protein